jgi:hypothetical protein
VQGIATPHASAWFRWCVQGSSGWISQTQPSAHWPQVFTAMAFRIPFGHRDISTTLIYAKITTRKRLEDVARYLEG